MVRKKKVLVTDYVWSSLEPESEILDEVNGKLVVAKTGSEEELISLARDVDAILTCFAQVTGDVIRNAPKCQVISRYGIGVDNIDVQTASDLGIVVTNVPDYCVDEVSDHVLALLLNLTRHITLLNEQVKTGDWPKSMNLPIPRLSEQKIGIVGFGKIGQAVCKKAQALGIEVLVHDPYVNKSLIEEKGASSVNFDELLTRSNYISIHTPLTPKTKKLFSEREFKAMKESALLINTARGSIVNQAALHKALSEGWIAGAGIDVLPEEPVSSDNPLLKLNNIIITPHIAFYSKQSVHELQVRAAREVTRVLNDKRPKNVVNPEVLG